MTATSPLLSELPAIPSDRLEETAAYIIVVSVLCVKISAKQ